MTHDTPASVTDAMIKSGERETGKFANVDVRAIYLAMQAAKPVADEDAHREALYLAKVLHRRFYSDVPQWRPLDTTAGIITQIDNMVAGLAERLDAALAAKPVVDSEVVEEVLRRITHGGMLWDVELTAKAAALLAKLEPKETGE